MRRIVALLALVAALVPASCAGRSGEGAGPPSSTTTDLAAPSTTTTLTTTTPTTTTTAPPVALGADGCPVLPPRREPDAARPRYRIDASVDLAANEVRGSVAVAFTPDLSTDRIVLRMWANGPRLAGSGARGELPVVTLDGRHDPTARPDATTWVITPAQPLSAGRTVEVAAQFVLTLPGPTNDRIARRGDAVRLGSWFPILPWEPGVGWAVEPPTAGFAEASLAPTADFDVSLGAPAGLTVMATGRQGADGRWRAEAVRDFAASVGRFTMTTRRAEAAAGGVDVVVGVAEGLGDDGAAYADKLVRVLEDMSRRFGAYPWPVYSLAITPDLRGGIEYPMHVLQGPNQIGRTTSHEVGHMWFYALVGNDQGRDPVLDEGLATWAEARFEGTLGAVRSTTIPADARGRAGQPMRFWDGRLGSYYRGVYVQGAAALAALGDPAKVDCALALYVAREAHDVATQADLVDALTVVFPDAAAVLGRYGIG